jgi:hypothetical protein
MKEFLKLIEMKKFEMKINFEMKEFEMKINFEMKEFEMKNFK